VLAGSEFRTPLNGAANSCIRAYLESKGAKSLPLKFKIDADKFTPLPDSDYRHIKETFAPYVDDEILDIVIPSELIN